MKKLFFSIFIHTPIFFIVVFISGCFEESKKPPALPIDPTMGETIIEVREYRWSITQSKVGRSKYKNWEEERRASSWTHSEDGSFQELLERAARQLDTDTETAKNFIVDVDGMARAIQDKFEGIASHKTDYSEKLELRKVTIREFFSSPYAPIQISISRLHQEKIIEMGIERYLADLSNLYKKYQTIELKFDQNYFKLGHIHSLYEKRRGEYKKYFEFTVDMWQMYLKCYDDAGRRCYKDWTKKSFHIIFRDEGRWTYKVKAVTVKEKLSFEEYERRRNW